MEYIEREPRPPLNRYVRALWYCRSGSMDHARELLLPTGAAEVILTLARDFLLECEPEGGARRAPAAQLVGARSLRDVIDTADLACLLGASLHPGGLPALVGDRADVYADRSAGLEEVWGPAADQLRTRLRELTTAGDRLDLFESYLLSRLRPGCKVWLPASLQLLSGSSGPYAIRRAAHEAGYSERRFSQLFRESVGLSPKRWCRVQRFQRAVHALRAGRRARWGELALECGYYDQAHMANEFRAFAGMDMTACLGSAPSAWTNHLPTD